MKLDAITLIDFYKSGHKFQYPILTEVVYSNFTPRSDRLAAHVSPYWDKKIVFVGLQGICQWLLIDLFNDTFFKVDKEKAVAKYKRIMDKSLGEGMVPVDHIEALHDLGYLPVCIKALPEGSRVNIGVPVFTIVNTMKAFFWLTNYLETLLSSESWKVITNATIAYEYKRLFLHYAELTGAPKDFVMWQGHDFSMRGMGGCYDAAQSGTGHLYSFLGTDTVPSILYLEDYYGAMDSFVGGSVPATEHSVMCMGGNETEIETFRRLIEDVYPSGIVSIVSDTWDFWKVITEYSVELKDKILSRTLNALGQAKVVFRPDSGDPVKILTGYVKPSKVVDYSSEAHARQDAPYNLVDADCVLINGQWHPCQWTDEEDDWEADLSKSLSGPEIKGAVECLWDIFGGTLTDKGFKVLHERVGLIYGDSITLDRAKQIMERLVAKGFASCNWVAGIGLNMAPSR